MNSRAVGSCVVTEDYIRELEKILEAVNLAVEYHTKTNEANAALHSSDRVLYSPLTVKLISAKSSLEDLLNVR